MIERVVPHQPVGICHVFEWMGAATGVLGALLLAINTPWSGYGFVAFLASNLFWITYGCMRRAFGLVTMQLVFTLTSVIGISRWLIAPG